MSGLEGKKKTLTEKIFGNNKENRPAAGGGVMPVAYHELETILDKERAKNKKLVAQLGKARAEVVALKTSRARGEEDADILVTRVLSHLDGEKAMAPNIPHRLQQAANKKMTKCPVCQDTIGLIMPGLQVHFLFISHRFCVS